MHSKAARSRRAAGASLAGRPASLREHHHLVAAHLRDLLLHGAVHVGSVQRLARGRQVGG
jgi:hypothetical protein